MAQSPNENPLLSYWRAEDSITKTPLSNGKYVNEEFPFQPDYKAFRKWKNEVNPYLAEKKTSTWKVPVQTPVFDFNTTEDYCVWLGHCTFLIQLDGIRLITDPVFNAATIFYPRKSAMPYNTKELPSIDYILLSHDHRDHCDFSSLRSIKSKNPDVMVLTGLKMESLLKGTFKKDKIVCAGWNQQYTVSPLSIIYTSARHWSKRGFWDFNDRLWGGFVIQSKNKSIYFSGDTGYGSHFKKIGERVSIDFALIGIGAYQPEWFMESNHISPTNAVQAFDEMNAKYMVPMHYGCFDLSNESMEDPIRVYRNVKATHPKKDHLLIPQLAENIFLMHP
jgi:L-ascorbate metabolism protein UlaG (beta-lactamase superfamily)